MQWTKRNLGSWFLANLLILGGYLRRAKERAMRGDYILSIYFHKPSKKEFEQCIRWLKKNNFTFLSTHDLADIIDGHLPFPKGGVLLTVDDGWQSNEENMFEVAERYGVPLTVFISTGPVEEGNYWWSYLKNGVAAAKTKVPSKHALKRIPNEERLLFMEEMKKLVSVKRDALTIEQVRKAARSKYITIGGHTHTHPILINCSDAEVCRELSLSKQKLESWIDKDVSYFAYPNGDYSNREIHLLKELDYNLAFCSEPRYLTPEVLNERFRVPRFGYLEGASFAENKCRMVGVWKQMSNKMRAGMSKKHKAELFHLPIGS
jgi:poly-beta-1,6-N-acetyl-D-glucosamine N-deacetylase